MADEVERQTLDDLGTELLLPLPGRNRLMGVMALGPKQSEAAYSKSDLHLLQVLATQTGMALEVSELAHSLAHEAAQRERVNREIEIAREVQERLFPQEMPTLPGASVAGTAAPPRASAATITMFFRSRTAVWASPSATSPAKESRPPF